MKKILLLGGSAQQVIAIEKAKELGYYTILCDYLNDNPGQYVCDKFYLESTTDKDRILEIAKKENIDGILAYASDPAAPTQAYVAEKLSLPTNPYKSVEILCNKDLFREFLYNNGFDCPKARGYSNKLDALADKEKFEYPIIIKPVDSSGSKGVTILEDSNKFEKALDFAFSFSRSKRIIIEKYINNKYKYTIGGDIFINNGKIIIYGIMNCFREHLLNPLVPGGEIFPSILEEKDLAKVKNILQLLVNKLQINSGCMNVELIIDKDDKCYLIDIGPRAGGNMIPIQLSYVFGVDIVSMSVLAAMGEKIDVSPKIEIPYCSTYVLHSNKEGIYKKIIFSNEIENNVFRKEIYKKNGDYVDKFDNASKALGIIFLKFDSIDEMFDKMNDMNKYIDIVIE